MKKLLFIYTSGRKERIEDVKNGNAPDEFLYGLNRLNNNIFSVDYLESDYMVESQWSIRQRLLKRKNDALMKNFGIGNRSHYFINSLKSINKYDTIVATTDSIAIGLASLKKVGYLRSKIIFLNMGLAGAIQKNLESNKVSHNLNKAYFEDIFNNCEYVISLGIGENRYFLEKFPLNGTKFIFIPFGVDSDYWVSKKNNNLIRGNNVLFIGNDMNRDFSLIIRLAKRLPQYNFKIISSRIKNNECSENVECYNGNWREASLSDSEILRAYQESSVVIVPINETLQPSGQSVSLQAMSCGKVVLITKTEGFWSDVDFKNGKNIVFLPSNDIELWVEKIKLFLKNSEIKKSFHWKLGK
tara:strand:- start:657 stop:1724 length:1068 start_codon:yes stop_codon:yes gene_type:complete